MSLMKMCIVVIVMLKSGRSGIINNVDLPSLRGKGLMEDNNKVDMDDPELKFSFTFPGTKWCGPGNTSQSYTDLGEFRETDMCCREHDFCPDSIAPFSRKHNLYNWSPYSRSKCICDEKFRQCLHAIKTEELAKRVGELYFNSLLLDMKCFRKDYPVVGCNRYLLLKCLNPRYDTKGERIYQWFDVPNF